MILSSKSNNSLVRFDKCFSKEDFIEYSLCDTIYNKSFVIFSLSKPVISHMAEFSFINDTVFNSDAGKTALLIMCVAANDTFSSSHPCAFNKSAMPS